MSSSGFAKGTWGLQQSWKYKGCGVDEGVRRLVRSRRRRAGVQSQQGRIILAGGEHGGLEESGGSRFDWGGGDFVYEKKVSGRSAGHRCWSGAAGGGVSGEIRE